MNAAPHAARGIAPLVAVTQRVVTDPVRGERRDALDQRLARWLAAVGVLPVALPNDIDLATRLIESLPLCGAVLSGGNDLAALGGDAPERDAVEQQVLTHAEHHGWPVLGLCRGLQMMAWRDGGQIEPLAGHAGSEHALLGDLARDGARSVVSHHRYGLTQLPPGWQALAHAPDGSVEAAAHPGRGWLGLMWHPERATQIHAADLALARTCLLRHAGSALHREAACAT